MKLNKVLVTVGLSLAVSMGVGAGLSMASEGQVKEANAATSKTTFYVDVSNSMWGYANIDSVKIHMWGSEYNDVYIHNAETGLGKVTVKGIDYVSFSIASYPGISGMDVYCWDRSKDGNITSWTTFDSFSEGQNLIIVGNNGGNWTARQPVTLGTLDIGSTYTVTKMAVEFVDGVAQEPSDEWGLGSDSVVSGDPHAVPQTTYKLYEDFGGWFTDPSCEDEYEGTDSVTSDFTIYAKYTRNSGNTGVVAIDLRDSTWESAAANYAVYYWDTVSGFNGWSDYYSASENQFLLSISYHLGFTPDHLKVVRYNSGIDEETWKADPWANKWGETEDLNTFSNIIAIDYDLGWQNHNNITANLPKVMGGQSGDSIWSELATLSNVSTNDLNHVVYSSTTVELTAGLDFKILHFDEEYWGYYSCPDYMTNRTYFSGGNGEDIHVEKSGTYTFTFDGKTHKVSITSADVEAANNWAKAFLGVTDENDSCTYSMSNWTTMGTSFAGSGMSDEARTIIAGEGHIEHDADAIDYIAAAVQRYDYVLERYGVYDANTNPNGFVDFAGRVEAGSLTLYPSANVGALVSKELANNAPAIIAIVSVAAIASTGMYFFLRKRKEN